MVASAFSFGKPVPTRVGRERCLPLADRYRRQSLPSCVSIRDPLYVSARAKRQRCVIDKVGDWSVPWSGTVEGRDCDRPILSDTPLASLCDLRKWFVRAVGILALGSMAILS